MILYLSMDQYNNINCIYIYNVDLCLLWTYNVIPMHIPMPTYNKLCVLWIYNVDIYIIICWHWYVHWYEIISPQQT